MIRRTLVLTLTALIALGASSRSSGAERPYFGENFERSQATAFRYDWKFYEGIMITGTPQFIGRVSEALSLVEEKDPHNWYFVRKHIRKITLTGHPGIDVVNGRLMSGDLDGESASSTAGGIVHEAWHRELHFRGLRWDGREAEKVCLERQNEFLVLIGAPALNIKDALASEYWKVDYWSRDW